MTSQEPPPNPDEPNPTSGLPSYGSFDPPPSEGTPPPAGGTPPPPGGYGPPIGGSAPFSAVDAIGYGWKKFKENAGPILLAALILIVASAAFSIIGSIVTDDGMGSTSMDFSLGGTVFDILSSLVTLVVSAAIIRGAIDVTEGKKFDLGSAFGRLPYANVIITSLIIAVLEAIGIFLFFFPALLVAFFTMFALYFVVDKDQSPIDAITSSLKLVWSNLGNAVLLILLSILVLIAGAIALCVGLLVALPVVILASAYAYKKFQGEPVAA